MKQSAAERDKLLPPIRTESVFMALTKGWPEPIEPGSSTAENRGNGTGIIRLTGIILTFQNHIGKTRL